MNIVFNNIYINLGYIFLICSYCVNNILIFNIGHIIALIILIIGFFIQYYQNLENTNPAIQIEPLLIIHFILLIIVFIRLIVCVRYKNKIEPNNNLQSNKSHNSIEPIHSANNDKSYNSIRSLNATQNIEHINTKLNNLNETNKLSLEQIKTDKHVPQYIQTDEINVEKHINSPETLNIINYLSHNINKPYTIKTNRSSYTVFPLYNSLPTMPEEDGSFDQNKSTESTKVINLTNPSYQSTQPKQPNSRDVLLIR